MSHSALFRECLLTLDVVTARKLWQHTSPHLPQPTSDEEMLVMLHCARTQAKSIPRKLMALSHAWLCERNLPSQLPDELKPSAERLYPRVAEGVGISLNSSSSIIQPVLGEVRKAMDAVVCDIYADDEHPDPQYVKQHMFAEKDRALKSLLGLTRSKP